MFGTRWAEKRTNRAVTLEKISRLNAEAEVLFRKSQRDALQAQRLNSTGDHLRASVLLMRSVQASNRGDLLIGRIREHYAAIGERMP